LDECLSRLGPTQRQPADLLQALESKHYLTSYQVGRLTRGETEGLLLGEFKLMYRNASGSFARVFRACSIKDGRMIGLKLLRQRWAGDPQTVAEFHREADLCIKLRHKNIVPIYDVASQGDYHYLTMEFVEGGNLRDFVNIRKTIAAAEVTRYAIDMAEGLEYALTQGLTHRDLKLTNVLMSTQGVAKLVDFGLAADIDISGAGRNDDVRRALEYAALESSTNAPANDPRTDLFFLGGICYELLTGKPPYPRTRDRAERRRLGRYSDVRRIRDVDPNIPPVIADIVERLMHINPDQRYQSPTEVLADLRRAASQLGDVPANGEGASQSAVTGEVATAETSLPTIMCIESRTKQQNILRDYLSKRGFRVLMLSDVERGLNRLRTNPPNGVVFMGESIGDATIQAFHEATRLGQTADFITLVVLSEQQASWTSQLDQTPTARVMVQPISLRDLRREIHLTFQRQKSSG
ncbi:MAG: protein kinase, partial [Planctomycetaceae bacterium]|nr:protein kinase [Planctomycetaceae bacterium]